MPELTHHTGKQARPYRGQKDDVRAPSRADLQDARILKTCSLAVVAYLREALKTNNDRLLRSLRQSEMNGLVVATIGAYIAARSIETMTERNPAPTDLGI